MTLRHRLLETCGVAHGFGTRNAPEPPGLLRPRQVHGVVVTTPRACRAEPLPEADAIVSTEPGVPVGVVTADCVPILLASRDGRAVAAVHGGWRGLALGVLEAGVDALRHEADGDALVAVLGPHIGPCCYEVDAPVVEALRERCGGGVERALRPSRPGHVWLDLGEIARQALRGAGLAPSEIGVLSGTCTRCAPERFHSYRRDGSRAGRLLHHVAAAPA